jgi:hypothetical protein
MQTLIGCDFSINKPAACILTNNQYRFVSWPYGLSKVQIETYRKSPITIIERADNKDKGDNVSDKLRYEVRNAKYLANLILNSLKDFVNKETLIAFEGLSYGSTGDVVLQLGGYKYILMDVLSSVIPLENMFTYAPITIKKTAGCSKKGTTKADMIEAFKIMPTEFSKHLRDNEPSFKTKGTKGNWITHVDDLVDSFWALETLRDKNGLI